MENQDSISSQSSQTILTVKKPGRILHFSDGVEEEINNQDISEVQSTQQVENVDPKSLSWGPWISHYAWKSGITVLYTIDYVGETLADLFGITTPKYQLEISEYERMQQEKKQMDEEFAGWSGRGDIPLVLNEPSRILQPSDV